MQAVLYFIMNFMRIVYGDTFKYLVKSYNTDRKMQRVFSDWYLVIFE